MRAIDLAGEVFGRLTVIGRSENSPHGKARWKCECTCGGKSTVLSDSLRSGKTKSCGCMERITHSDAKIGKRHRLNGIWACMRHRCRNPNHTNYSRYGGRGITVCAEWDSYVNFKTWALANGYAEGLTIDRIDNDGNYEPDNCQWMTMAENLAKGHKEWRESC